MATKCVKVKAQEININLHIIFFLQKHNIRSSFILVLVGLPILCMFLWGQPYKRGFFCDDESIKHPFHESTVKSWMLWIIGFILPVIMVSCGCWMLCSFAAGWDALDT